MYPSILNLSTFSRNRTVCPLLIPRRNKTAFLSVCKSIQTKANPIQSNPFHANQSNSECLDALAECSVWDTFRRSIERTHCPIRSNARYFNRYKHPFLSMVAVGSKPKYVGGLAEAIDSGVVQNDEKIPSFRFQMMPAGTDCSPLYPTYRLSATANDICMLCVLLVLCRSCD